MDRRDEVLDSFKTWGLDRDYVRQLEYCASHNLPAPSRVYTTWIPQQKTLQLLHFGLDFVKRYKQVTVRQVYYGMVVQGLLANHIRNYHKVVRILKRARLSGLIPFHRVVDDTREAEKTPSWDSIEDILDAAVKQYRSDWWEDQFHYIEVWLEKRALRRIFYPVTNLFDVHLCVGGGYQSWSEIWEAKKRFENRDQPCFILYFGDLDPSGKDIPRDIQERFKLLGIQVEVVEIALTKQDVEQYNLPPNPTKPTDSRCDWYTQKYGITYGVELDALPPDILKRKIVEAVMRYADMDLLRAKEFRDNQDREKWADIIRNNGFENEED